MGRLIEEYKDIKLQQECVSKTIDALWKIAIKYQKIEQIYSDYLKYMNPDNLADRIGEVLEDDKI